MDRKIVEFSEGEFIVKSYQCAVQKGFFSRKTDGYLQVTNKRIIYATSSQIGGSSLLVSELPLMDVGPISSFIGKSIKIWALLLFVVTAFLIESFLVDKLPEFMTHWAFALVLMLPWFILWLIESNVLNQDLKDRIIENLGSEHLKDIGRVEPSQAIRTVFKVLLYIGILLLGAALIKSDFVRGLGIFGMAIPAALFTFMFLKYFGLQDDYILEIASKTGAGTGITIRSASFQSLFAKGKFAYPGWIVPSKEAAVVAKELGSLVMDLQQTGDLAAMKWAQSE